MSKRHSDVWLHFSPDESRKHAKCNLCEKWYSTGGGTSNLLTHMRKFHKEHLGAESSKSLAPMYSADSVEKKRIDAALRKFIVSDMQSFSLVDNPEFEEFIKILNPRYSVPGRRALSRDILTHSFEHVQEAVRGILARTKSVALTTDAWTSNRQDSYLAVTAHFIHDGRVQSACLECCVMREQHTAENIAEKLKEITVKWNIVGRIAAIVTDNAPNIVNAVKCLGVRHVPCAAHTLNLVFNDATKRTPALAAVLAHCTEIVTFFRHSNTASGKLAQLQEAMGRSKLRLVQHVVTRWNRRLAMISRLLEVKDELIIAQSSIVNAPPVLSAEEWVILEEVVRITTPLQTMTTSLSGEQYVTCSQIVPFVHGLVLELSSRERSLSMDATKAFYMSLLNSIQTRLFPYETRSVTRLATFFDTRFKKVAFRVPEHAEEARKQAEAGIVDFLKKEEHRHCSDQGEHPAESSSYPENSLLHFLSEKSKGAKAVSTATTDATICIRQYIERRIEPHVTDPVTYWLQDNRTNGLCDVAMRYLCIPAASVPAERIFSKAGQIITDRRNSLSPETAEVLIFLNGNKNYLNDSD